jgi:hypothetical protein
MRHLLLTPVLAAGLLLLLGMTWSHYSRLALPPFDGHYVHSGVPFVERDGYATSVCVSNRAGVVLPPFFGQPDASQLSPSLHMPGPAVQPTGRQGHQYGYAQIAREFKRPTPCPDRST